MRVFKCNKCGNIVVMMEGNEKLLRCCGEELEEVSISSGEGEVKHKPVMQVEDDQVYIRVGEVEHPMDEDHYISWILVISKSGIRSFKLNPGDKPECVVPYEEGMEVFAYCNKHSLWKSEL